MSNVVAFKRPNDPAPEVWLTLEQLCDTIAPLLGGRRPTVRWTRYRITDGMPSRKFLGRRMVPRDRGLGWLRDNGFIP